MTRPAMLLITFSTITADARVLKQVRRFARDYDVHTVGYGEQPDGAVSHVRIPDEYPIWRYDRIAVILRRFRHAYWTHPAISHAVAALDGGEWDVIFANDIDAAGLALSLTSRHGVHLDLHEYAPRQKEDVWKWRVFVAPFIRWMCRRFATRAQSVTTVGEGIAKAYLDEFGIAAGVVTNAAPYVRMLPHDVGTPIKLVHSGAGLRDRNISAILDAVERTTADVVLDLYLTPNDPGFLEEIRARSIRSDRIVLHDPVPYTDLATTLNAYDIGVHILPPVNFNNLWALPNKFFDYVQARLGVIIGPSPEMAGVLSAHGFGTVTSGFSPDDLTAVLDALTVEQVRDWKSASDRAAEDLSGERQTEHWAEAVDRLVGARP